jgi:hypothetical protein
MFNFLFIFRYEEMLNKQSEVINKVTNGLENVLGNTKAISIKLIMIV